MIITIVPLKSPADPTPATARPTMNALLLFARAEMSVPIQNTNMKARNVFYAR
jgi:hypothetical protein